MTAAGSTITATAVKPPMPPMHRSLAARVAVAALLTTLGLTAIVSLVEISALYLAEHRRMRQEIRQVAASVEPGAMLAAYHIDATEASAVVTGLLRSPTMQAAVLRTELGEVLAEGSNARVGQRWDAVSRWLFEDGSTLALPLATSSERFKDFLPERRSDMNPSIGMLELTVSPEAVGARFFTSVWIVLTALLVEVCLFAGVLLLVFHRYVTAPLARIGEAIDRLAMTDGATPTLDPQLYQRDDELGQIVAHTNEMVARLREQQDALLHREKVAALGSLLTGVAHELNNPLAIVLAQTELLAETARDEATRARADKIMSPAKRCARIVHTFLSMARNREMAIELTSPREMVEEAVSILDYSFQRHGIDIVVESDDAVPNIHADPALISQVVLNLLINSMQAVLEQGGDRKILVSVAPSSEDMGGVSVTVSDTGPGIPMDLRNQVLQPFFTTKKVGDGTGLGLSYANSVVLNHGGSIHIFDSALGGAGVRVLLPSAPPRSNDIVRAPDKEPKVDA